MSGPRQRPRAAALWVALAFSALAHALTLTGGWLTLPQSTPDPAPLTAHLAPAPAHKPAPVVQTAKPKARPPARVAAAPVTLPAEAPVASLPMSQPQAAAEPMESEVAPEPPAPAFEPVVVATAAPSTFLPEPAQIKTLPWRGRIAYNLHYYVSDSPALVGHTVQTWEAADNQYRLDSRSEPAGLARLTRHGPRVYRSSGVVTERGLQPREFVSSVTLRGKADESAARFDWAASALQFGRAHDLKNAALPAGSQDLLSFMYQFALAPPPRGRVQMPITNGTRFESYDIDVLDEETIETPMGTLRALPVKQVPRAGRESIQVWLAADYHYLPVRILVINRDGSRGGEQVATAIQIGDNRGEKPEEKPDVR